MGISAIFPPSENPFATVFGSGTDAQAIQSELGERMVGKARNGTSGEPKALGVFTEPIPDVAGSILHIN